MDNYQNPKIGKTYISPSLSDFRNKEKTIELQLWLYPQLEVGNMQKNMAK
ncbi:hypothetical protein [uncultured Gilliamella sp.]|nr:hypothetical protein [uncultured Gilliamella sp.]